MRSSGIPISPHRELVLPRGPQDEAVDVGVDATQHRCLLGHRDPGEERDVWGPRPGALQKRGEGQPEGLRPRYDGVVLPPAPEREEGQCQSRRQLSVEPAPCPRQCGPRRGGRSCPTRDAFRIASRVATCPPPRASPCRPRAPAPGPAPSSVSSSAGDYAHDALVLLWRGAWLSYRVGMIVEQALGHRTHAENLQQAVPRDPEIEAVWGLIPWEVDGLAARLPLYGSNWTVRAGLRARRHLARMARSGRLGRPLHPHPGAGGPGPGLGASSADGRLARRDTAPVRRPGRLLRALHGSRRCSSASSGA